MSVQELAQASKAKGNAAFSAGRYDEAISHFTEAIQHDPTDAIFFSNRSGAYASLQQPQSALEDAERCLQLNPSFIKGYSRKGQALFSLNRLAEAKAAYEEGLKVDPANSALKEGLEQVQSKLSPPPPFSGGGGASNPFASMFGPDMWGKLMADPITRQHLSDPSFKAKMNELQRNPSLFGSYTKDPKVSQALGVLLGLGASAFGNMGDLGGMGGMGKEGGPGSFSMEDVEDDEDEEEIHAGSGQSSSQARPSPPTSSSKATPPAEEKKEEKKEKAESEMTQEEKDKRAAEKEKEAGNAAFKAKKFDEAIAHYEKAAALDATNLVYPNNAAACYFEKKDYERCIEQAQKAIAIGQEPAGWFKERYKDVAKAWSRIGNAYAAQKRWDEAIAAYEKSSVEEYNDKVKAALKKAHEAKKKQDELSYIDPEKSEEEKAKGNELFQQGKWFHSLHDTQHTLHSILIDTALTAFHSRSFH